MGLERASTLSKILDYNLNRASQRKLFANKEEVASETMGFANCLFFPCTVAPAKFFQSIST